jgi:U3 small nucleolar RNA-associated protein 14
MPKNRRPNPEVVDHVSDSEDEEIDEDEAFNSDDERKYGAFFASSKKKAAKTGDDDDSEEDDSEDDDDGIASDDDDEEGDGGNFMLDLLSKLDAPTKPERKERNAAAIVKESEFAASVLKSENLTLDDLMTGLQDTKGFGVMQKTFKQVAKGKTTAAPVAKVVSNRAQRKVAYEHSTKDVSGWIDVVQQNRQAETLDFRPKERPDVLTKNQLVDKFEPTTDFEKELAAALKSAGQHDEAAIQRMEEEILKAEDLDAAELTLEEYEKRRGQLAKMRALMFYHEQKRHHINKIKSKKYRRIRKKQRERLKESEVTAQMEEDPDLARDMEEKEEVERMRERMTLAHKNTSKWAKRVLKRGKNVDVDTRRALSAQLARGDDLRRKMNSTTEGEHDSGTDSEGEDLVESARKVLADADNDDKTQNSGLFGLAFMRKGIEKQRERAKQEARQLLRELEANNEDEFGEDEGEQPKKKKQKKKVASASEMKGIMESGKLVASSLDFGNSNAIAVDGGIDIDLGDSSTSKKNQSAKSSSSEHTATLEVSAEMPGYDDMEESTEKQKGRKSPKTPVGSKSEEESNPWLAAADTVEDTSSNKKNKKKSKYAGIDKRGFIDVEGAASMLTDDPSKKENKISKESTSAESSGDKNIVSLTQEELVRRAFVAPTEEEVDEEFAKEKAAAEERDDPSLKKELAPNTVSGWGSWTGDGAPAPRPPRKLPKHLRAPHKKKEKRKRQDEQRPNIIVNEKRMKKTANSFQIARIPYPYKSREEYERAMTGGIGKEWNVSSGVKNMTRPEIITRSGKIIQPISKRAKAQRPAAKF